MANHSRVDEVFSWDEYEKKLKEFSGIGKGGKVVAYYFGNVNKDDPQMKSWCPDCVLSEDIVAQALPTVPDDVSVVRVAVGDRPTWKDQENVYRKKLSVRSIPTLIKFANGKEIGRLEDMECAAPDAVNCFLQNW